MFGSRVGFLGTADRTALFTVLTNPRWRPPAPRRHLGKISNGHISATSRPIHFMFCSRVGFSGTADRTALFPVRTNPPPWTNLKWPYLRNRSSDLVIGWGSHVFGDGGSNGVIFDLNKFKMAAAAILDNFEWPHLRNSSRSTYIARISRSSLR